MLAFGFAYYQTQVEEARMKTDLDERSRVPAESLADLVESAVSSGSYDSVSVLLKKYVRRAPLIGGIVLDAEGHAAVSAGRIGAVGADEAALVAMVAQAGAGGPVSRFFEDNGVYVRVVPMSGSPTAHSLALFYDTSHIRHRVARIWAENALRALVQSAVVSFVVAIILWWMVIFPLVQTVDWIRRTRKGEVVKPRGTGLFGPIGSEVRGLIRSLEEARHAAEVEARLRHEGQSVWTSQRLRDFVSRRLGGAALVVVSNREPYVHERQGSEITCAVPAGGLVTALEPILKACGGMWVAHGAGDADRESSDATGRLRVPPDDPQYALRRVWLSQEEIEGYYEGFSNEGLWPLCHLAHTRPVFREADWLQYREVNEKFARVTLEEIESTPNPLVLIQDYHLALVPELIKQKRPDARVGIFWHIPWPNPENFGICPWQRDILKGMLGADLLGFHTRAHCNNFLESVERFLESRIDYEHHTIHREGRRSDVRPFPISVDPAYGDADNPAPSIADLLKPHGIRAQIIGVGVDRLDYTKGILERFQAIERFFELNPEYVGKLTFVQLGAPSRSTIQKYREFIADIDREAERINTRFKAPSWIPILLVKKNHGRGEIVDFYRRAAFCIVSSLHDGMNLVAKEYVLSRSDGGGALILSEFTGAARELRDAFLINPYDTRGMADAIRLAIESDPEQLRLRMNRMRATVCERNIFKWAADITAELMDVDLGGSA